MAPGSKKMTVHCLNSDRISSLPQDITGHILTCMPIRDAVRTSILSRNWRSGWKNMTKLHFDGKMVKVSSYCSRYKKYKLASAILNVLLLHTGSIHDIKIDVRELDVHSEFDQIIFYLSRNNHLQNFFLFGSTEHCYKLPYSFFSLQGLEVLELYYCLFTPPIIFDGFSKLRTVVFGDVHITSKTLKLFLSSCPLLRNFCWVGDSRDFARGNTLTFVELLQCVPLIESLEFDGDYIGYMCAGGMPYKLPTPLVQLRSLSLGVCFDVKDEVSFALCLIRSSPHLQELCIKADIKSATSKYATFPDIHNYSGFTLDYLEVFSMKNFSNDELDVDFLKLIIAKSPWLVEAEIELCENVSPEEEIEILRDLLRLPFPHASPSAKLIIKRPEPAT